MYKDAEYRVTLKVSNADGFGTHNMVLTVIIVGPFDGNWSSPYADTDGKAHSFDESGADNYHNQIRTEFGADAYKHNFQDQISEYDSSEAHSRHRRVIIIYSSNQLPNGCIS